MTTRNLDALFAPQSIALVGASARPGSVGQVLARNLATGGFAGAICGISLHPGAIEGLTTFGSLSEAPAADLVVIATPPQTVPKLLEEAGARGARAAVVITAGLADEPLRQQMLDSARRHMLRVVGPNCLGFISPTIGVNASFAHLTPGKGGLALVAQSGAVATAAMDWAVGRGFGFSHVVTLGDMADVDFGDLLDYLALDPATSAILLYVESVTSARKFMSAARAASRVKPVVVVKAGRSAAGAGAAFSHTRALAGSDVVYDAAFRRAGLLRVAELREMFDAVATLTAGVQVKGDRLAILTNGGGAGVMAVDALEATGGRLAKLPDNTIAALDRLLPRTWSKANPVDIIGDAPPERFAAALDVLDKAQAFDAVLVLNCPTALASGADAARAVADRAGTLHTPMLTCWLGDPSAREARSIFAAARTPSYETPEEAVRAFGHLVERRRNQRLLMETPAASSFEPDRAAVRALLRQVGPGALSEPQAKAVLSAYGVPVLASVEAPDPGAAGAAAQATAGPYALKILSPEISHKSDVGGVALNLESPEAVEESARAMIERLRNSMPAARLQGFIVQQMVSRPHARELIVGIAGDPTFGPVVMFGAGGVEVEVLADRSMGLPPLNRHLALDMIDRTRVARRLAGFRDRPAADVEAIAEVLTRLSQLALDFPEIAELDINPLLADEHGVLALDARLKLTQTPSPSAIAPYPAALARTLEVDGRSLLIRAIKPEDEPLLVDMTARSEIADLRFRFRASLRELPHEWAARLSQIDYDREMALVAVSGDKIIGVARLAADPEGESAEFALFVRSDRHRQKVGSTLMRELVAYARARGVARLWGEVLVDNKAMLALTRALGFKRERGASPELIRVSLAPKSHSLDQRG